MMTHCCLDALVQKMEERKRSEGEGGVEGEDVEKQLQSCSLGCISKSVNSSFKVK